MRYVVPQLFAVTALLGQQPARLEKQLTVPGTTGLRWVDTGVDVKPGETVKLSASGEVDVKADWGVVGPEGSTRFAPQPPGYYPLESRVRYGLVARVKPVKGKVQAWAYGEAKEVKATRAGRLWLTVNDDAPENNTGEFQVTIQILEAFPAK